MTFKEQQFAIWWNYAGQKQPFNYAARRSFQLLQALLEIRENFFNSRNIEKFDTTWNSKFCTIKSIFIFFRHAIETINSQNHETPKFAVLYGNSFCLRLLKLLGWNAKFSFFYIHAGSFIIKWQSLLTYLNFVSLKFVWNPRWDLPNNFFFSVSRKTLKIWYWSRANMASKRDVSFLPSRWYIHLYTQHFMT